MSEVKASLQLDKKVSLRKTVWKRFRKNRAAFIAFCTLCFLIFVSLFASLLSSDQPLHVKYKGENFYPAFSQHPLIKSVFGYDGKDSVQDPKTKKWEIIQYDIMDWRQLPVESITLPLIPYSPKKSDIYNRDFVAPGDQQFIRNSEGEMEEASGRFRHHLGTDALGRDVLSGLIHGTKISLSVGIVAMGIATIIGLFLGSLAGFFGDHQLKISRLQVLFLIPGLFFGYFYGFIVRGMIISLSFQESIVSGFLQLIFSLVLLFIIPFVFVFLMKGWKKGWLGERISLPIDSIISRFMEIFNSMPKLLLIISFSAIIEERSLWLVMVIIGLTSWSDIARFNRAEMLRIRELEYITAARSLGYSNRRIIFKHALPNAMSPILVTIAFGIASAILIESGLSFLNIGVPADTVTWGSMLNTGRVEPEAWWMIVFPGLAIFITVTVFNLIGDGLRDALDPKSKGLSSKKSESFDTDSKN